MKIIRGISLILGFLILGFYVITCIAYWATVYGALGLFGALLTIPFSILFSFVWFCLMNWTALITNVVWVGLGILFLVLGSDTNKT